MFVLLFDAPEALKLFGIFFSQKCESDIFRRVLSRARLDGARGQGDDGDPQILGGEQGDDAGHERSGDIVAYAEVAVVNG